MRRSVFLILLVFVSCEFFTKGFRGRGANFIILCDQSKSFIRYFSSYSREVIKIVNSFSAHDKVSVISINSFSDIEPAVLSNFEFKIPENLSEGNPHHELMIRTSLDSQRAIVKGVLFKLFNTSGFWNTDIIGALKMAENLLDLSRVNVLIIFSDMINDVPGLNFERLKLDSSKVVEIISSLKMHGYLPNFKGVKVYVVGVRAVDRGKLVEIRNFWYQYFKATGAVVKNYGSSLDKEIER